MFSKDKWQTVHQLKKVRSGHYMAACCYDNKYIYYADSAFPKGKTRIPHQYVDDLAYDVELSTGRLVQGFVIEVPIKL